MKKIQAILMMLGLVAAAAFAADTMTPVNVKGTAAFENSGNTLTVTTGTQNTVIEWNGFSIAEGAAVHFQQPGVDASVLNRVLGSDISRIDGLLSSNGRVYLVNPNGIVIGPNGMIRVADFVGSTLNVEDMEFLSGGEMNFRGDSTAAIVNLGTIDAIGGDVYLIARKVVNAGTIRAEAGSANLVAASDVLLTQDNGIYVRPALQAGDGVGVDNRGLIEAVTARLEADGNMYAMAINNSGVVRATGLVMQGGRVMLTATGGSVVNTGTLSADREVRVVADSIGGTGRIETGAGGLVETSADELDLTDMDLAIGAGGTWLIDPPLVIGSVLAGAIVDELNQDHNVSYTGAASITVDAPIVATPTNTTTFLRLGSDTFIAINADINVGVGRLYLQAVNGVAQAPGTTLTANMLQLRGGGMFDLSQPTNDFGTVAIEVASSVDLVDANDLIIGNVSFIHGASVQGGELHISTMNGFIFCKGLLPGSPGDPLNPGKVTAYHALGNVAISERSYNSQTYEIRISNEGPQAKTPAEVAAFLGLTEDQLQQIAPARPNEPQQLNKLGSAVVLEFGDILGLNTGYAWNFRTAETFGPFSANDYALVQVDPVGALNLTPQVLADVEAAQTAAIQDSGEFSWQTGWANAGHVLNGADPYTLSFAAMGVKHEEFLSKLFIRDILYEGITPPEGAFIYDRIWDHVEDFPHLRPDPLATRGGGLLGPVLDEVTVYFNEAAQQTDPRYFYQSVGSIYQIPR